MSLLRSVSIFSAWTLVSRITGLLRDQFIAIFFGASVMTDAFNIAFRLPNLLRRIFAEGAFSQAFVPLFAATQAKEGRKGSQALFAKVANVLFWILLFISILGVLTAPVLVYMMASGLAKNPTGFEAAIVMTRIVFPYILCMSLVAMASAVLNTYKRFAIPAFTPVLLNISMITMAWGLSPYLAEKGFPPIYALAIGAMLGGLLQLSLQLLALAKIGFHVKIHFAWRVVKNSLKDPKIKRILTLMAPVILGVSVAQISLLINTQIASYLSPGSVTWLSYADRLMEFPTALLGVALGTVLIPQLSRANAKNDPIAYSDMLDWGLRIALLFGLPCMVALLCFTSPIVTILFNYGKFSVEDVHQVSIAVTGYATGIMGFLFIKILAPAYYARLDTKTPVKIAIFVLFFTQVMNIVFVPWLQHAGLALSIAIGALVNSACLMYGLIKRQVLLPTRKWFTFLCRLCLANGLLALFLYWVVHHTHWVTIQHANGWTRLAWVMGVCLLAGILYILFLYCFGIKLHQCLQTNIKKSYR